MFLLTLLFIVIQLSQLSVDAKQPPPAPRSPVVLNHARFGFATTNTVSKTPMEPSISKQKATISTTSHTTQAATYKLRMKYPAFVSSRLRRKRNPEVWCTEVRTWTAEADHYRKKRAATFYHNATQRGNANARQKRNANTACDRTVTITQTVVAPRRRPCGPCSIRIQNRGRCVWSRSQCGK